MIDPDDNETPEEMGEESTPLEDVEVVVSETIEILTDETGSVDADEAVDESSDDSEPVEADEAADESGDGPDDEPTDGLRDEATDGPDDEPTEESTEESTEEHETPEVSSVGTIEAVDVLEEVVVGEDTELRPGLEKAPPYVLGLGPLKSAIESLIFVSDKPLTDRQLAELAHASVPEVRMAALELMQEYEGRGLELHLVAGGYQFRSAAKNAAFVRKLVAPKPVRLSRALLETLSIVAYRQPVTRPEVDDVRGVDSGEALKALAERDLVRILGRKEEPGRPLLYGTTKHFLEFFGLNSLRDLPTLREYAELNDESRALFERKMGEPLDLKGVQAQADAAIADAHARMLDSEPSDADAEASESDEEAQPSTTEEGAGEPAVPRDDDETQDDELPRESSEDEE